MMVCYSLTDSDSSPENGAKKVENVRGLIQHKCMTDTQYFNVSGCRMAVSSWTVNVMRSTQKRAWRAFRLAGSRATTLTSSPRP